MRRPDLFRPDPWARLYEAERLLASLERGDRADLDEIERALTLLLAARRDHARPPRPRKPRARVEGNLEADWPSV
jgi:hypothetical protein